MDFLKLNVGDEVVVSGGSMFSHNRVEVVERTTKTQIILCGEKTRYRRIGGRGIGEHGYYSSYLKEATPERINEVKIESRKRYAVRKLRGIDWDKVGLGVLNELLEILDIRGVS